MNIKSNILNYLIDKDYVISIYDDNLYIYKYDQILDLNDECIILSIDNRLVKIYGKNLSIIKMTKYELAIKGVILDIKFGDSH